MIRCSAVRVAAFRLGSWETTGSDSIQNRCILAPACLLGQKLQPGKVWGMSEECQEPGPDGPQGGSPGSGGYSGALGSGQCSHPTTPAPWSLPRWRAYAAAGVLCYINLLNYMNWFIIAGEEGDRHPGQPLPIHPLAALPPWWPPVQQAFFLWGISLCPANLVSQPSLN